MLMLQTLTLSLVVHAIVDSLILVVVISPVLYLYMANRQRAGEALTGSWNRYADVLVMSSALTVLWLVIVIATMNFVIMLVLHRFVMSHVIIAILGSLMLAVVVSPVMSVYISLRKQAEELYRTLASSSPVGVYIVQDRRFRFVNPQFQKYMGFTEDELLGTDPLMLIHPEDREMVRQNAVEMLKGNRSSLYEFRVIGKGGETRWAIETVTSVQYKRNRAVLGNFMDITERKRMEQELREAQEQLIRSEKLAAIGQLAAGVGHELRNPLGAIKNAVYYVKGKVAKSELAQKEPRVMEFLDIVDDEINASNKIISDLLGFSRVGKPALSPARINKVIEDALSRLTIPENIEVAKKLDAGLPEFEIDTDQIRQVMVNILLNAVQAMPEGGKLTLSARARDKFLEVEISDTGCGIPKEAMGKIFDPLFTTKAKGIGLGLAVCKAIIDRHEGNIEVKSETGRGTTVNIKLPLKME